MLKWTLRIIVTLIDIALLAALWWVVTRPNPIPAQPTEVVSVSVEDVTPEEVQIIMDITGGDEDGGILNEE